MISLFTALIVLMASNFLFAQTNADLLKKQHRVDSLIGTIYQSLDSIYHSETSNYIVVGNDTIHSILNGEFTTGKIYKNPNMRSFEGTCGFARYEVYSWGIFYNQLGKQFDISFGTLHTCDVKMDVIEPTLTKLLANIQSKK